MIGDRAAFWLGYIFAEYCNAWLRNHNFFGSVSEEIAIHFMKRPLLDGRISVEIGVKSRPGKDIGSWYSLDTPLPDEADQYINECRELLSQYSQRDIPFIETRWSDESEQEAVKRL